MKTKPKRITKNRKKNRKKLEEDTRERKREKKLGKENRTTSEKSRLFYWHFRRRAKKYTWKEFNMTQTIPKRSEEQKKKSPKSEWPDRRRKIKSRIIAKITKW